MRAVVQRVTDAEVRVDSEQVGQIGKGLVVYLGVGAGDGPDQAKWMANKLSGLRIFPDEAERMTRSALDLALELLVISQFTLYGDVRKGRRPSFDSAAPPESAEPLYEATCDELRKLGLVVQTGRFRADMRVAATVDGPVTILIDSDKGF